MSKSRIFLLSPFQKKTITICNIWTIFARKQGRVTYQRVKVIDYKGYFRKLLTGFSSLAAFLVLRLHFWKNWVRLPDAEFNAESISTNFKFQNWERKKFECLFLIAFFHFETNLIKGFSFFPDPFGQLGNFFQVGLKQNKLAGSDRKIFSPYQPWSKDAFLLYADKI